MEDCLDQVQGTEEIYVHYPLLFLRAISAQLDLHLVAVKTDSPEVFNRSEDSNASTIY
jgi:hypothetical protein